MKSGVSTQWLLGATALAALMMSGRVAFAAGDDDDAPAPAAPAASDKTAAAGATAKKPGKGDDDADATDDLAGAEEVSKTFHAWIDMVLGFGKEDIATQLPPAVNTNGATLPSYTAGNSKVTTESFIFGLGVKANHNISIGMRVPLTFGQFYPDANAARGSSSLGNLELEGEYERKLNPTVTYLGILGISLPTAQGTERPEDLASVPPSQLDQGSYDKTALNRAAALSRGSEDNALYELHRFGINPKLAFEIKAGDKVTITPYLKMENLIGTTSSVAHGYLGELVPAVRAGFHVHKNFEPALRMWGNWAFAGSDENTKFSFAVEPQLIGHFGDLSPSLGFIMPVVGNGPFTGVRFAVGGNF